MEYHRRRTATVRAKTHRRQRPAAIQEAPSVAFLVPPGRRSSRWYSTRPAGSRLRSLAFPLGEQVPRLIECECFRGWAAGHAGARRRVGACQAVGWAMASFGFAAQLRTSPACKLQQSSDCASSLRKWAELASGFCSRGCARQFAATGDDQRATLGKAAPKSGKA